MSNVATPCPAAGEYAFECRQCEYDYPMTHLPCASCRFCDRRGGPPVGYPFGQSPSGPRNYAAKYPPAVPLSGSFQHDQRGAWNSYGRPCTMGPNDFLCPFGMRSVKVAEPNVWTCLPNQVPAAVAINNFHNYNYINDIYENRRGKPYQGCRPGRAGQCACPRAGPGCKVPTAVWEPKIVEMPAGAQAYVHPVTAPAVPFTTAASQAARQSRTSA